MRCGAVALTPADRVPVHPHCRPHFHPVKRKEQHRGFRDRNCIGDGEVRGVCPDLLSPECRFVNPGSVEPDRVDGMPPSM